MSWHGDMGRIMSVIQSVDASISIYYGFVPKNVSVEDKAYALPVLSSVENDTLVNSMRIWDVIITWPVDQSTDFLTVGDKMTKAFRDKLDVRSQDIGVDVDDDNIPRGYYLQIMVEMR